MLKSFSVSNFKAFEKSVTIDFSATGKYDFNKEAVKDGLVKTAVVYGANAGGKSSLSLAIFDIVTNLSNNFAAIKNYINYKNLMTDNPVAFFEYKFIFDNATVTYSYSKPDVRTIIAEKLVINEKTVVEYDKSKDKNLLRIDLAGTENLKVELARLNFSALRFVRANAILENTKENAAFNALFAFVDKMLLFWALETREFVGYTPIPGQQIVNEIVKRGNFSDLQKFFRDAGIDDEFDHRLIDGSEQLLIKYNGKELDFGLACSSGMSALLLLYYWLEDLSDQKKCPSFILIDEFDAFYHYELARFVIEKLKACNCQVLLTSHNTALFSNDLLRPDCYYICSKNRIVNASNATDKELRFGHNLEKLYRGGTFGR